MTTRGLRPWDWARAGLITVVLLLQFLDAIPLPELKPRHLANPVAQVELRQWSKVLGSVGVEATPSELAEVGLEVGGWAGTFRKKVLRPWHPFRKLTGTGQAWGLFAYPEPAAGRLVVAGQLDGKDHTFYSAPGGLDDDLERVLEYRRVRGIYDDACDRPKPKRIYGRFAKWVSARVMTHHLELDKVEVRIDHHQIRTPDQGEPVVDQKRRIKRYTRTDLEQDGLLDPSLPESKP